MTDTSDSDGSSDDGTTSIHGWGDGRRSALDAIEEKPRLDLIESVPLQCSPPPTVRRNENRTIEPLSLEQLREVIREMR